MSQNCSRAVQSAACMCNANENGTPTPLVSTQCILLQPRRRDFTRSSQGLPDLHSALLASAPPQHCAQQGSRPTASDWQNTLLPRDPSWALPNPHQRPATAATCPPSAYGYTAEESRQWSDSGHAYQYSRQAAAAASGVYERHHMVSQQQASAGSRSAFHDDRATTWHPGHLLCAGSLPPHRHQADVSSLSPLDPALSAARSRPRTAQHMLDGRGTQPLSVQHPACQLQADYAAGGLYSPHSAQGVFTQPVAERLCVHTDEPAHQHACSRQQPQSDQSHASRRPGGWFQCSESSPIAHDGEDASLLHQGVAVELTQKAPTAVYAAAQHAGLGHMRHGGVQHLNFQTPDDGNIAAMEKVLADYKALRLQISEAEAQLLALRRGPASHEHVCWSQPSGYQHRSDGGVGYEPCIRGHDEIRGSGDDQAYCREVTSTLRALKAAAARQRPAVEAVASQLRSTLSMAHDISRK